MIKSKVRSRKLTNSFKFLACLDPEKLKVKVTIFTMPYFNFEIDQYKCPEKIFLNCLVSIHV